MFLHTFNLYIFYIAPCLLHFHLHPIFLSTPNCTSLYCHVILLYTWFQKGEEWGDSHNTKTALESYTGKFQIHIAVISFIAANRTWGSSPLHCQTYSFNENQLSVGGAQTVMTVSPSLCTLLLFLSYSFSLAPTIKYYIIELELKYMFVFFYNSKIIVFKTLYMLLYVKKITISFSFLFSVLTWSQNTKSTMSVYFIHMENSIFMT